MENRPSDVVREEMLERLHSRGDFLKLLGAAGVGAAAGTSLLPGSAEGAVSTSLEPTDFHFTTRERFRPFTLLAKNFVQLDDGFSTNTRSNYTVLRPGPSKYDDGQVTISNGKLRFAERSDTSNDYYTVLKSGTGQRAPYATVIIDVASLPNGAVYAGLYKDGDNYVHAYYDKDTHTVGLEAEVGGQYFLLGGAAIPVEERALFDVPFRFAFVANENEVTALVGDPASDVGNYRPIIKKDVKVETGGALDLRRRGVLATFKNGFGARSETGSTIIFDRARAGYFGEAGVRDPHVVQYADGTPYIKNNKLFFTLTNAGLGFFEKAHWGVWTMDLSDYTNIEQVGNIFWYNANNPDDGDPGDPNKVYGHSAGQIVRDEARNRWIVVVSSWGDFGPQGGDGPLVPGVITYPDTGSSGELVLDPNPEPPYNPTLPVEPYYPPVDILYDELPLSVNLLRGVHILEGKRHPVNAVPFPTEGKWDPGLTRIGGRWYLSYVIALDLFSNFQPALARSPIGGDHKDAVQFVGADWSKRATEGPIIQKLGGEWRMFASCGDDEPEQFQGRYPIYFLRAANPDAPANLRPRDTDPNRLEPPTAEEERLRRLAFDGYLDAPHPTNIPHPQIVPISITVNGRRRTKYIMITFNGVPFDYLDRLGYGTHGDFYVMQATRTVAGWEFPRR